MSVTLACSAGLSVAVIVVAAHRARSSSLPSWTPGDDQVTGLEEPEPDPSRQDIRDVLDVALSRSHVVDARLDALVRDQLRDLRRLPQQLQGYYVMEADR